METKTVVSPKKRPRRGSIVENGKLGGMMSRRDILRQMSTMDLVR